MRFGPLRFRVAEERGRIIDPRLTGRLLHVDANSDMPAFGDSFLRIFVNINPERDREWLTSLPLAALLDQWGDSVRVAGEGRASAAQRACTGVSAAPSAGRSRRTPLTTSS